jgi:hypothetical protein
VPRALLVLTVFLSLAAPALAGPFDPGARAWTVAGKGTEHPLGRVSDLVALPDGSVVISHDDTTGNKGPVRIDAAGGVQALRGGPLPSQLAAAADGTLYAALGNELRRWDPAARTWPLVADVQVSTTDLAVATDGTVYATGKLPSGEQRLMAVVPGGAVRAVALTPADVPARLAALPDGRVALGTAAGTRALTADGTITDLFPKMTGARALVATATGDLLRISGGVLQRWAPDGGFFVVGEGAGSRSDGAPAVNASFPSGPIAAAPDGTVFFAGDDRRVRAVASPDAVTRAFAAVTGETDAGIRRRKVAIASSTGGTAVVVARTGSRSVRASGTVAVGTATITLPRAPVQGETDVTVTVTAADGRRATATRRVLTWRTLPVPVGLKVAQSVTNRRADECDDGSCFYDRARDCRRVKALVVECRRVRSDVGVKRRCLGTVTVTSRPEGYVTRKRDGGCRRRR